MHSKTEPFSYIPPLWSEFRSMAYGYTRFTIHNETHAYAEQIDVDQVFANYSLQTFLLIFSLSIE